MREQTTLLTCFSTVLSTKIVRLTTVILLVAAFLFSVQVLNQKAYADESCSELLKNRCTPCHYLTRVCQKLERNRKKGFFGGVFSGSWSRTIRNMVKQGAKLNDAEQKNLTECLDNSAPEVLDTCGLEK